MSRLSPSAGVVPAASTGSPAQRERRTRILEASVALARDGGFDAVQMREVADGADVALGTLYRYFPSKVHLLVAVLARELARANDDLERRAVPGDTAADRVAHVLGRATRNLQQDPLLTEALVRAFMFADATVAAETDAVEAQVVRLLLRAMASGDGPERVAVAHVVGDVWLATLVRWVTGRLPAERVDDHLDTALRLLLPGG